MEDIINDILILVKKKMREQGGYDHESYRQFVEETVDYFVEKGKLSEEDNLDFLITTLLERWEDVENKLADKESR
jgi:polyhydroxyalkanoate synthesis regulator phasin